MSVVRRALARPFILSAAAALLASAPGARAQSSAAARPAAAPAESTVALTIDDAVREALDHNLALAADRYSVDVARARIVTARLRPNPVLTLSAMLPDATVFAENISPREEVLRTDVVIEGGGKRQRRIDVAEAALSVEELQLLNAMRELVLDIQNACIDVVQAQQNVALARESLDAFDALVRINTDRVRSGDLSEVELSRSRLAALQFQNDVRQQQSKLIVARSKLKTLLGRAAGSPDIEIAGELRRDTPAIDVDALRQRALAERPDVAALRRDQARSSADLRLQIAQGRIDYTISGEVHHQRQATPANADAGYLYGAYLSVPLPIFNRNQGEVQRARVEEQQAQARVRALEADVAQEVAAACESFAASRDVVRTIETEMLDRARDVRSTTEYSYRRGEASFIEFLDAVRAFNDTMQSYNDARADYARSLYTLDAISGASVAGLTNAKVTP
jgi:cobalt-zinc-cadmium efflux system outer membrane protein